VDPRPPVSLRLAGRTVPLRHPLPHVPTARMGARAGEFGALGFWPPTVCECDALLRPPCAIDVIDIQAVPVARDLGMPLDPSFAPLISRPSVRPKSKRFRRVRCWAAHATDVC
jgi:hypothetical protein